MPLFFSIFLILSFGQSSYAAWNDIKSKEFPLQPFPQIGSREHAEEIQILLDQQEIRTVDDCELADSQRWPNFRIMFAQSGLLTDAEIKKMELLERVVKFASRVADYHKGKWTRPRPYTTYPDLVIPCVEAPSGDRSYPSSHAAMASAAACVAAEVFPGRADAILDYGEYLSDLRVLVSVHYPSDVEAGKDLGQAICERLLNEEDFQDGLKALRDLL